MCWRIVASRHSARNEAIYDEWIPSNNDFKNGVVLRKNYWKILQQGDLPESMPWCIIGRLECEQTKRTVVDAVGVVKSEILRLWNRQEKGHPRATTANSDQYISCLQLIKTEQPM
ncbi:hypothetical protein TNCV_5026381 [Trichonephila clavipes]|uniref:Uncharacterized protein n=1 Tax=Trichonephila clavipes TaxID=2585209 RepID=A0A8X6VB16_TRICX|nr:hypothetical protein TNCV_5026381 [Trichonephila clavipes]